VFILDSASFEGSLVAEVLKCSLPELVEP